MKRRLADAPLESQRLLIPPALKVTPAEADVLAAATDVLARVGVVIEPFGPTSMAIQQFPTLLIERDVDAQAFVREALDTLSEDETADSERLLEDVLELIACKAAVKAGDGLSPAEIDNLLLRGGADAAKSSACPHGRPTTLKLTFADLAKQFHRS